MNCSDKTHRIVKYFNVMEALINQKKSLANMLIDGVAVTECRVKVRWQKMGKYLRLIP